MKKFSLVALMTAVTFLFMISIAVAQNIKPPNGAHYNLNVIGFAQCKMNELADPGTYPDCYKGAGDIGSMGHTIFVPIKTLWETNPCLTTGAPDGDVSIAYLQKGVRILVSDGLGDDLYVVDRDATDGDARLNLPQACYEVWARAAGKPGGCMDIETILCYDLTTGLQVDCTALKDTERYVRVGHLDVDRSKGEKQQWQNATGELLPAITGVGAGTPGYFDFFWEIFNNNLRLLQLRIIRIGDTCP